MLRTLAAVFEVRKLAALKHIVPPGLFDRERLLLLLEQRRRLRDRAQVDPAQVEVKKLVEERLAPAVVHLVDDGGEVVVVFPVRVADGEDEPASRVEARRDDPVVVAGGDYPRMVVD